VFWKRCQTFSTLSAPRWTWTLRDKSENVAKRSNYSLDYNDNRNGEKHLDCTVLRFSDRLFVGVATYSLNSRNQFQHSIKIIDLYSDFPESAFQWKQLWLFSERMYGYFFQVFWHLLLIVVYFFSVGVRQKSPRRFIFHMSCEKILSFCFFVAQFFTNFMTRVNNVLQRSLIWFCSFSRYRNKGFTLP
jgi:hypothetical protein